MIPAKIVVNNKNKVRHMLEKDGVRQDANSINILICTVGLTAIALLHAPPLLQLVALLCFAALLYTQYQQRKTLQTVMARSRCFYRLGRRLVRLKRNRQRDTDLAVNVLNHMVNQSQVAGNTQIWQRPMGDFSGDVAISCKSRCGKTYLLLADLTGHGIAAAIGATPVASIFQATAYRGLSVQEILVELNDKLNKLLPFGHFCCAAVAVCHDDTLEVCNAGLPDLVVCNETGVVVDRVTSTQLPLGIEHLDSNDVEVFTKHYAVPHQLYAFTDGLIESRGQNDDVFDSDTVEDILASGESNRLQHVVSCFERFSKGIPPHDDISIVEVKIC
jgi:hypothetical protein